MSCGETQNCWNTKNWKSVKLWGTNGTRSLGTLLLLYSRCCCRSHFLIGDEYGAVLVCAHNNLCKYSVYNVVWRWRVYCQRVIVNVLTHATQAHQFVYVLLCNSVLYLYSIEECYKVYYFHRACLLDFAKFSVMIN